MKAQADQNNQNKSNAKPAAKGLEAEQSPWTEPFLRSQETGTFDRVTDADAKADQKHAERSHANARKSEDRPSDDATHDALSTIFHGH